MDFSLRQCITDRAASFNGNRTEVLFEHQQFLAQLWFQDYFHRFCLSIGIGTEIQDTRTFCPFGQIVFLVACNAANGEAFDEIGSHLPIAVNHVIDRPAVVAVEYIQVNDVFPDKHLFRNFDDLVDTGTVENDNIVDIRAVTHKLVFLQGSSDEAFRPVDI